MKAQSLTNIALGTILLVSLLLAGVIQSSSVGEYDPWSDLNEDGEINIFDLVQMAGDYGTTGTPINKTDLLLQLVEKIESLNDSITNLEARVTFLESLHSQPLLVGFWQFNEGIGGVAFDSSGKGNDGTIHGASWTTGKHGAALHFNGTSDYVEIPSDNSLNCVQITVEAWVKTEGTTGDHQVIVSSWPGDESYVLEFQPNGITPQLGITTTDKNYVISNIQVPIGSWAHIAATYDGSVASIYVNGVLAGSGAISGEIRNTASSVLIGAHDNPSDRNWFKGIIDQVRIYDDAITQDRIIVDMNG